VLSSWTQPDSRRFLMQRQTATLEQQSCTGAYTGTMASTAELVAQMRQNAANVRFTDLRKVCEAHFGLPRRSGGSHVIFKAPWPGDPRVNIQSNRGFAKPYQVRQVLLAIDKLQGERR